MGKIKALSYEADQFHEDGSLLAVCSTPLCMWKQCHTRKARPKLLRQSVGWICDG